MPPDTESAQVTITLDGQTLYDQMVSSASGSVAVTVTGPAGTHEVQVSVGGGAPQPYTATFNS